MGAHPRPHRPADGTTSWPCGCCRRPGSPWSWATWQHLSVGHSMAASQGPSVILGRQACLSGPYADTCWGCRRKRVSRRKLLRELKQCFLHIKLRALVVSALPCIQYYGPKLYLKSQCLWAQRNGPSVIGYTPLTKRREEQGQKKKRPFGPSTHLPQILFEIRE